MERLQQEPKQSAWTKDKMSITKPLKYRNKYIGKLTEWRQERLQKINDSITDQLEQ
jgi:hypothetical protein